MQIWRYAAAWILVVILVCGCTFAFAEEETVGSFFQRIMDAPAAEEATTLEEQLAEALAENEALRAELAATQAQLAEAVTEKEAIAAELAAAQEEAASTNSAIQQLLNNAQNAAQEVGQDVANTVSGVVENVEEAVTGAVENAQEAVEQVAAAVEGAKNEVVEAATDVATETEAQLEALENTAEEAAAEAAETVESVEEAVTDAAEEAADTAAETVAAAEEAVADAAEAATETATEAVEAVEETAAETVEAAEEAVTEASEAAEGAAAVLMNHAEFAAAEKDTPVIVETYVQAKQSWWQDKATIYTQAKDGAYFIYELPISQEDYDALVPGTKIRVSGYKTEWSGEVEIVDATYEVLEAEPYIAEAVDVTALLGTDELAAHQNEKVAFKGMTVEAYNEAGDAFEYKNAADKTDDLYFKVSKDGQTYDFCVEFYLCGADTDVYKAVTELQVGDVIDLEGFLYWYNGANPHITAVTPAQ